MHHSNIFIQHEKKKKDHFFAGKYIIFASRKRVLCKEIKCN